MMISSQDLTAEENDALQENLAQLGLRQPRAAMRSAFYNGKKRLQSFGFSIPPQMRNFDTCLGWPAKTCDVLSSRLQLGGFVLPGQAEVNSDLADIFALNRMAVEWPQVQVAAFMHGCAFVAVTPGTVDQGEPAVLISSMPATEATGIWDVRRRALRSALWVPQHDAMFPTSAVLFLPSHTVQMSRDRTGPWWVERVPNILPRLPVTLVRYRPQLDRPFGMSRITRPVMELTQMAVRTLLRTEVSAEFYSSPQRWAMGAEEDSFVDEAGSPLSAWETILGKVWMLGRDEEGNTPAVGQFPQATMQPHNDMLRMITTLFAGETSLPVSTLGIIHDNPASAEAIDAAWADMVGVAELCQVELGEPAVEIAQNALMLADKQRTLPPGLVRLRPKWRDASTPTRAAMTDATVKQIQVGVLRPDSQVALEQLGYDQTDIERIIAEHKAAAASDPIANLSSLLNQQASAPADAPVPAG